MTFTQWFSMGGYGLYVWPAYLAAFIILGGNLWWAKNRANKRAKRLQSFFRRQQ